MTKPQQRPAKNRCKEETGKAKRKKEKLTNQEGNTKH